MKRAVLIAIGLVVVLFPAAAVAATLPAKDVRCKGCIGAKDLGKASVTATKLAPASVNGTHVAPGSIGATHLAPGAIASSLLAGGAVTAAAIAPGAIGSAALADGSVTALDLAAGAVTSQTVADGSLTEADLAFAVATQAELDAHAASADHDARYYTEGELNTVGVVNTGTNPVDFSRLKNVPGALLGDLATQTEFDALVGAQVHDTNDRDPSDNAGVGLDIAIGADGLPLISHSDFNVNQVRLIRCTDISCNSGTNSTIGTAIANAETSVSVGGDGIPVVLAANDTGGLSLNRCTTIACTAGTSQVILASTAASSTMAIGPAGFPYVVYQSTGNELFASNCTSATCSTKTSVVVSTTLNSTSPDMIMGLDGFPVLASTMTSTNNLRIHDCSVLSCGSNTATEVATANVDGITPSIALGSDGMPVIAHHDSTANSVVLVRCTTINCSASTQITVDTGGSMNPHVMVGPDGFATIAYDKGNNLMVARCVDIACSATRAVSAQSKVDVGGIPALAFGIDGNPIIAHHDNQINSTLVTHCSNRFCIPYFRP